MPSRLLPPEQIPPSLWSVPGGELTLPEGLAGAYRTVLEQRGWLEDALAGKAEGQIGGASEDSTRRHFVGRFGGSCARVELVLLDPSDGLGQASDGLINALAGGRLGLLDIPCGAGAAAFSLLSVIATLRAEDRLPRQPLEVFLLGGDHSDAARSLAASVQDALQPRLEAQAIHCHSKFVAWDACDRQSTTELLHTWMEHARDCRRFLVFAANCSGFLEKEGKFKKASPNLEQVFRWAKVRRSDFVWIEPQTRSARRGLLPRLIEWVGRTLRGLFQVQGGEGTHPGMFADVICRHPLKPGTFPVHLSLVRFEQSEGGDT